jgi:hypothetical protein
MGADRLERLRRLVLGEHVALRVQQTLEPRECRELIVKEATERVSAVRTGSG